MGRSHAKDSITLVACCGPKLTKPAPAADLFVSSLFKKDRTHAERRGRWFVLSALHGLVDPTEVIAPYDVTLKGMPAQKRRERGRMVRQQMGTVGLIGLPLVALAGADYVKPLVDAGLTVAQPMRGHGIGKQLQWLNRENGCSAPSNRRPVLRRLQVAGGLQRPGEDVGPCRKALLLQAADDGLDLLLG
jgi:hypothetical protein